MKRIMLVYGGLAGAVIIGIMVINIAVGGVENASVWVGYLVMLVALSLIFFGVKSYRDDHLGGVIKFRTAFKVGLGISVVAGIVYVGGWEIYLQTSGGDFMDQYASSVIEKMQAEGATEQQLADTRQAMEEYKTMYKNPFIRTALTFIEIFPMALLITLISAALLRNSSFLPAKQLTEGG